MTVPYADPMTRRSADSEAMLPYWDKVDAINEGIEGLRKAGETYLPKFTGEQGEEYIFRLKMTKVTGIYQDIVEGLSSKPFEQPVTFPNDQSDKTSGMVPPEILDFSYDVDGSGNNLTVFAAQTFYNGINNALDWIMVDYPPRPANVVSVADQRAAGLRPYWMHVLARNILDVKSMMIGGKEVLTYVKIFEPGSPDRVREFTRSAAGDVTWKLYERTKQAIHREGEQDTFFAEINNGVISIGVIPLVPFITSRRDGRSWKFLPVMKNAADLQIELYQQESALKFLKVMTAYPMLGANGMTPPKGQDGKSITTIAIGPTRVLWGSPSPDGRIGNWSWIEPSSENLKFLAADIEHTIQQLRELGRQPLTASTSNITVITAAVAAGKAKSAVKAWALLLKDAIENALKLTAKWMAVEYDPTVDVFVDFDDWMDGADLETLDKARERKDITQETYWEELGRRGVLSTNFTAKRERARMLEELPDGNGEDVDDTP